MLYELLSEPDIADVCNVGVGRLAEGRHHVLDNVCNSSIHKHYDVLQLMTSIVVQGDLYSTQKEGIHLYNGGGLFVT